MPIEFPEKYIVTPYLIMISYLYLQKMKTPNQNIDR